MNHKVIFGLQVLIIIIIIIFDIYFVIIEKNLTTWTSESAMFSPLTFDTNDFWFTQNKNQESMSHSNSSSNIDSSSSSRRDSQLQIIEKSKLIIRTDKISVKLEAGVSEQIPLIGLNLLINGELNNWKFSPSLNFRINLEMAYFNEALTAWEPVIEPVEDENEKLRPYEIFIDVIFSFYSNLFN